jgi:integrase
VPLGRDPVTGRRRDRSVAFHGTKREAERELARLVAEADEGRQSATQATLAVLLERWWDQKQRRLSPTTSEEYRRLIDRRIVPDLGRVKLSRLTAADLDAYYLHLERKGGLAPSSIRQVHAIVSGALRQAVKWRWIAVNPARDASLPPARRSRIEPPSPAKVRALMTAAEEHSPEMGMFIRLAALLGARRGEVCGLQWEDFDDATGTIKVRRGVVEVAGALQVKDTKTHAERIIALDPGTVALLSQYRAGMESRAHRCGTALIPGAFILSESPDGSRPMRPDKASDVFKRLRTGVGLDAARLHDLRHFVATQLIGAGHDIRTVSGRLGHAQTSTTLNTYAAFLSGRDRAAADQLAALLDVEDDQ